MKKIVVLVSGGLDSFVAYRYAKMLAATARKDTEVVPMFVDCGQPYYAREAMVVKTLFSSDAVLSSDAVVHVRADLCRPELGNAPTPTNYIINGRNALFAFYGGLIGDEVWLASLSTNVGTLDKSPQFFFQMSALMTHLMQHVRLQTLVKSPFIGMTKTDVIRMALNELNISEYELLTTLSCYADDAPAQGYFMGADFGGGVPVTTLMKPPQCGKCGACFARWVGMINNGLYEDYATPIVRDGEVVNEWGRKLIEVMREEAARGVDSHKLSKARKMEVDAALIHAGLRGIF